MMIRPPQWNHLVYGRTHRYDYLILVYSGAQKTEFSYKDESFSKVEGFSQGKSVQKFCTNNVINK